MERFVCTSPEDTVFHLSRRRYKDNYGDDDDDGGDDDAAVEFLG